MSNFCVVAIVKLMDEMTDLFLTYCVVISIPKINIIFYKSIFCSRRQPIIILSSKL